MYCHYCGHKLPYLAKSCPNCTTPRMRSAPVQLEQAGATSTRRQGENQAVVAAAAEGPPRRAAGRVDPATRFLAHMLLLFGAWRVVLSVSNLLFNLRVPAAASGVDESTARAYLWLACGAGLWIVAGLSLVLGGVLLLRAKGGHLVIAGLVAALLAEAVTALRSPYVLLYLLNLAGELPYFLVPLLAVVLLRRQEKSDAEFPEAGSLCRAITAVSLAYGIYRLVYHALLVLGYNNQYAWAISHEIPNAESFAWMRNGAAVLAFGAVLLMLAGARLLQDHDHNVLPLLFAVSVLYLAGMVVLFVAGRMYRSIVSVPFSLDTVEFYLHNVFVNLPDMLMPLVAARALCAMAVESR